MPFRSTADSRTALRRARAEDRLGDDFDLRPFHDTILESGSIPLDLLEKRSGVPIGLLSMAIRAGELEGAGIYPVIYRVNARLDLYAEPARLQEWTPRHPAGGG